MTAPPEAPAWRIAHWMNGGPAEGIAALRGKVVLAVAFQMLCPGCVAHGLPQAQRARAAFPESELAVIGLHTVFEHHEAQGSEAALRAFLHEYRIDFPVGIDAPSDDGGVPQTMRAYAMQGTPTTILIDRQGRLRLQRFGHLDDMRLGALIASLSAEASIDRPDRRDGAPAGCDAGECATGG
jgi:hypothetical protein